MDEFFLNTKFRMLKKSLFTIFESNPYPKKDRYKTLLQFLPKKSEGSKPTASTDNGEWVSDKGAFCFMPLVMLKEVTT